jgi:hypothetical protein
MSPHSLSISNGMQQIVLPTQEKKFQSAFHQQFENKQEQLKNLSQRMGIALLDFSTDRDLTKAMQQFFGNGVHDPLLTSPLPGGGTAPSPGKGRARVGSNDSKKGIQ